MNIIKITELGYKNLSNPSEWTTSLLQPYQQRSATSIKHIDENKNKYKQNYGTERNFFTRTSFGKTSRTSDKWTKSQNMVSKNIYKQMEKRQCQKVKEYQWPVVTSRYRKDISQILSRWKNEMEQQKQRQNNRVKQIYTTKYFRKNKQNHRFSSLFKIQYKRREHVDSEITDWHDRHDRH